MTRAHEDAPRVVRAVFRRLLPGARRREVLLDLDREYAAVRERGSRTGAGLWYVAQLLRPDTWRLALALRRLARADALPAAGGDVHGFRSGGGRAWLGGLSLDLRLAWRMLLKSPGLTVVGVLGIAIGTALGVGAFVAITGMFFPKLPLDEGERVVALAMLDVESDSPARQLLHDFVTWRAELRSVEHVAAATIGTRSLVTGDAPAVGVSCGGDDGVGVPGRARAAAGRAVPPAGGRARGRAACSRDRLSATRTGPGTVRSTASTS